MMARARIDISEKLVHKITIRVSSGFLVKMEGWKTKSNCATLAELARRILYKEEILWLHKNTSTDALAVELVAIRKELKAIGVTINQVVRYFNSNSIPSQKIYDALKVLDEYKKISAQVDKLLTVLDNVVNNGRQD